MEKIYKKLNYGDKNEKTLLDDSSINVKYCIEKNNVVLMNEEQAYYEWISECAGIEEDFIGFAYHNLKSRYNLRFFNCDGYTTDSSYCTEEQLQKLIKSYPVMYDFQKDELVCSSMLLKCNEYLVYEYYYDDERYSEMLLHLEEDKDVSDIVHIANFQERLNEEVEGWGVIGKKISYDIYKDNENQYYKVTYDKYGKQLPVVELVEEAVEILDINM